MDVKTLTGEEIAKILGEQYELLLQTQGNIMALKQELRRREGEKKDEPKN